MLLSGEEPYLADYHGPWGLDTRVVLDDEQALAGPKFNCDGSVCVSWSDPPGWPGAQPLCEIWPPGRLYCCSSHASASRMAWKDESPRIEVAR